MRLQLNQPMRMKRHLKLLKLWFGTALLCASQFPTLAESKHSAEKRSIKSEHSDVKALITFYNRSSQTVKVYWLDFAGNRVLYKTLKSQEGFAQATFLTHPWLVTDADDNAWDLYYPDAQPRRIEIIAPAAE